MKRIVVLAVAALSLAACKKESAAVVDAGAVAVAGEAADAGFVLTAELLDAYLRYQKAAAGGQAPTDGGVLLIDRAKRDEAAMKENGLTDAQVTVIDEMVSTVIARRMVTSLAGSPGLVPNLAALGNSLDAEQKKHMEEAMAAFRAQQQQAKDLTEERKRYGSKNIDVLLTREPELVQAWAVQMNIPVEMMRR